MAKAVRTPPRPPRGPVPSTRAERSNYFADVVGELRKVVWPTWDELRRMTGIVILTVIILAVIIGVADLLLSIAVKQLYVQSGSTTIQNFQGQTATSTVSGSSSASSASSATTSTGSASSSSSITTSSSASSSSTSTH
ncbi:MAG TPA: preprotein translocase subunit SecE [Candidatus Dormibacteraeota bacterium]|nr:preprotein translocase subunit SecE [Candidatus Dormibacteraeota bacterium]